MKFVENFKSASRENKRRIFQKLLQLAIQLFLNYYWGRKIVSYYTI